MAYPQPYHRPYREHGVRIVKIRGVPVSISYENGGHIIFGRPEYQGQSVRLIGKAGTPTYGKSYTATFQPFYEHMVAVFHRVPPGEYYADTYISGRRYETITINTNFATQSYWQ